MSAFAGLFLVFLLLWLVFAIVLPVWVYSDAQQHSDDSPLLWALVAFFGGILGFLLYLIIGRN